MQLRLYKFEIVAICQEVNDAGEVLRELPVTQDKGVPFVVFGRERLQAWADDLDARLVDAANQLSQAPE